MVLSNDGSIIDVSDPDISIVINLVQVISVDYYGMFNVSVFVYFKIHINYIDILDNDCAPSPTTVTVIGLMGC
jgi:hypothetical protein